MATLATPAERAAAWIQGGSEALARDVTEAFFRESPALLEHYGERGWQKCLQDMRHNWEHLAPAVELEAPEMFAEYARWVDGVLRSRNVPTGQLARCLELMEEAAAAALAEEEAAPVARCVRAGLVALSGGEDG